MASSEDDTFRIKAGASLLSKGGTLTSEPCSKCKGVQVRIGEKTTCINCGNEVNTVPPTQPQVERENNTTTTTARKPAVLASVASMIEEKIVILASEIRKDDEIFVQKEKAELLERYLVILEKVKSLLL
ncbi:MAG: Sjogren's syndrome/scleroderma autoantigen 1 family protein [Nitrososphaera sp.]